MPSAGVCQNVAMASGVGLRERKKARTRESLAVAALDLFARQGFDATTIEEIADACEVSPRTFFRYFPTKEAALFGDGESRRAALLDALANQPAEVPPLEALHAAMVALARSYRDDRDVLVMRSKVLQESVHLRASKAEHQRGWEEALTEELARRARAVKQPLSRFELRLVSGVAVAALRAALDTWIDDKRAPALDVLVDRAFTELTAGFASLGR
jgi:AcrR family transcriptional regulator